MKTRVFPACHHRVFEDDPGADFLNWGGDQRNRGTGCLAARTKKACLDTDIKLKLEHEHIVVKNGGSEQKTNSAIGIGRFLTQKVVRPDKYRKLIAHQVHGASYTTLQANDVSNRILTDIHTL
jgi:hypothetical protein